MCFDLFFFQMTNSALFLCSIVSYLGRFLDIVHQINYLANVVNIQYIIYFFPDIFAVLFHGLPAGLVSKPTICFTSAINSSIFISHEFLVIYLDIL